MTPDEAIRRANDARQIVDAELFVEARKHVYEQLRLKRKAASISDTTLHTRLVMMEQAADWFFGFFDLLAQTGKIHDIQVEQQERRKTVLEQGLAMFRRDGRGSL